MTIIFYGGIGDGRYTVDARTDAMKIDDLQKRVKHIEAQHGVMLALLKQMTAILENNGLSAWTIVNLPFGGPEEKK